MDSTPLPPAAATAAKVSRLAPFAADLHNLRSQGYTLGQCLQFLEANGVSISLSAMSSFLRRRMRSQWLGPAG